MWVDVIGNIIGSCPKYRGSSPLPTYPYGKVIA